jgi:hypothetical protein
MGAVVAMISGTLFRDPEERSAKSGKRYVNVTVACPDGESSTYVRVTAFDSMAAQLLALRKGDAVAVTGRFRAHGYIGKDQQPAAGLDLMADRLVTLRLPMAPLAGPAPAPGCASSPPAGPMETWDNEVPF